MNLVPEAAYDAGMMLLMFTVGYGAAQYIEIRPTSLLVFSLVGAVLVFGAVSYEAYSIALSS